MNGFVREKIQFTSIKPSHEYDEMVFSYFNPRLLATNQSDTKYSNQSIAELKDSIRMYGLQQPLMVNKSNGEYGLLDGHRRYEAISQLIKDDTLCFNESRKSWVKAKELYENLEVQVFENLTTTDAFAKVFCIDNNKKNFDEHVIVKFIDYCLKSSVAKQNIAKMCHKPVQYVEQIMSSIQKLNQDEYLRDQVFDGKIEISVANDLLDDYPDDDDRKKMIDCAWELAEERTQRTIKKLDDSILTAVVKLNKAKRTKQDLVAHGKFEEVPDVDDEIEQHMQEVDERKTQRSRQTPTINKKDVATAAQTTHRTPKSGATTNPPKQKISSKQITTWHNAIKKCIENNNLTKDGEYVPPIINMFLDDLMKTMLENDEEIDYFGFLQNWVPQFIDNGLDTNAGDTGTKVENKPSPFDDDDDNNLANVKREQVKIDEDEEDLS